MTTRPIFSFLILIIFTTSSFALPRSETPFFYTQCLRPRPLMERGRRGLFMVDLRTCREVIADIESNPKVVALYNAITDAKNVVLSGGTDDSALGIARECELQLREFMHDDELGYSQREINMVRFLLGELFIRLNWFQSAKMILEDDIPDDASYPLTYRMMYEYLIAQAFYSEGIESLERISLALKRAPSNQRTNALKRSVNSLRTAVIRFNKISNLIDQEVDRLEALHIKPPVEPIRKYALHRMETSKEDNNKTINTINFNILVAISMLPPSEIDDPMMQELILIGREMLERYRAHCWNYSFEKKVRNVSARLYLKLLKRPGNGVPGELLELFMEAGMPQRNPHSFTSALQSI